MSQCAGAVVYTAGIQATGKTITPPSTTGDITINAMAGSINFGSTDTTV
jgi:hypothetical protein